jgi:hypothetical protein
MPHPLPPRSVRLVVVPLADNCPCLASTAAAVAADILSLLPPGCKVWRVQCAASSWNPGSLSVFRLMNVRTCSWFAV